MRRNWKAFAGARAAGYRSGLEQRAAADFKERGAEVLYEEIKIRYVKPEQPKIYLTDFVLKNGIIVEMKGIFSTEDRTKHRLIHEQHPDLDIRFVFSNPAAKIGKKSKTTYAAWCNHLGIKWAHEKTPQEWIDEPHSKARWAAIEAARYSVKNIK